MALNCWHRWIWGNVECAPPRKTHFIVAISAYKYPGGCVLFFLLAVTFSQYSSKSKYSNQYVTRTMNCRTWCQRIGITNDRREVIRSDFILQGKGGNQQHVELGQTRTKPPHQHIDINPWCTSTVYCTLNWDSCSGFY